MWKTIPGHADYEVSDCGSVRRSTAGAGTWPGRILAQQPDNHGYPTVALYVRGAGLLHGKRVHVHRLVAWAFIGPQDPKRHHVNHKNGNKSDNRLSNLEYVTASQNAIHAMKVLGTVRPSMVRGVEVGTAVLSDAAVREIKRCYVPKYGSVTALARRHCVSRRAVMRVVNGETWKHVR